MQRSLAHACHVLGLAGGGHTSWQDRHASKDAIHLCGRFLKGMSNVSAVAEYEDIYIYIYVCMSVYI